MDGIAHVYEVEVEPTGAYEDDPNATDKDFPGNTTRSDRRIALVRVVREVYNWTRLRSEALQAWRERIPRISDGPGAEVIN